MTTRWAVVALAALVRAAPNASLDDLPAVCGSAHLAGAPLKPWNASARTAWVTHVDSNPKYVIQAGVLFTTLKLTNTTGEFVLLCVKCGLGKDEGLRRLGVRLMDTKLPIQPWELSAPYRNHPLVNKAGRRGEGEVRNGLSDFVKLRVHQLIDYAKVVFLDADIMVRGNVDHLFWLPEGSHSDGPHAPFNAGLVVVEPRKEDFRHLVAVVREGNFTDATGWRGEGGCASAGGCNARHVTQGLWDWFYRTSRPGGLRLPRDVYNGLQDEPADGADPCLVHFTACGKPSTGACGKNPAVPMATGKKKPSDRYVGLCERSHGEWRAREAAYCQAYGPPVIKVPKAAPGDKIADARAKIAPGKVPSTKGAGKKFGGGAKKAAPAAPAPCGGPRTIHEPPRFGHAVLLAQVLLCVVVACLAFRAGVVFASPPGPPGSPPASPRRYGPPRSGTLPRSSSRRSTRARS